ncbi:xanthine dehydrogenase/oxidase-like [Lineus longissimus]|uniref:xanthine dehydrogenase/oxidase-like n=1 Tax=Lineus longissimus TaxID=88925 RepID=UPI002B4EBB73
MRTRDVHSAVVASRKGNMEMLGSDLGSLLVFYVNRKKIVERNVDPEQTLLWYLRNRLRLVGTKVGCGQGGCGACTVMISEQHPARKAAYPNGIRHYAVMACLVPLCTLHGKAVTTVEGIGNTRTNLHPIQERLAKAHGVQCGFCSPGMVISMYALLRNNPKPDLEEIQTALQGNLCRCTGYRSILSANATFAKESCSKGADCCMNMPGAAEHEGNIVFSPTFDQSTFSPLDETQDHIFPSELELKDYRRQSLKFKGPNVTYYQTTDIEEASAILQEHPQAKVVGGCTAIAQDLQKGSSLVVLNLANMEELRRVTPEKTMIHENNHAAFGSMLTISEFGTELKNLVDFFEGVPGYKNRCMKAIFEKVDKIAATQIRNIGTIGGNIGSRNSSHDLTTWLAAVGCKVSTFTEDFLLDMDFYAKDSPALQPGRIIDKISIPLSNQDQYYRTYKHSKRGEFDWAVLSCGMGVHFDPGTTRIKQLTLAFSNLGIPLYMAKKTGVKAIGRLWDETLLSELQAELLTELNDIPPSNGERMSPFKKTLAAGFLFKFFHSVNDEMQSTKEDSSEKKGKTTSIVLTELANGPVRATQVFEEVPEGQSIADAVGRPLVHQSAFECAAGNARFADDIPKYEDEVHVVPVLSKKAHAKILGVDLSAALDLPGVVCYLDHHDVPGKNKFNADEELFASEKVTSEGVMIGAIVAEDSLTAKKAAKLVKVNYEELKPIISIEEAMAENPNKKPDLQINVGDLEAGFKSADHVLEGEFETGAQEHFYMETNAGIAVPSGEHQEMDLIGGSQSASFVCGHMSTILGVHRNRINIRVKRIGGGFGGKEQRPTCMWGACVVAANKLQRPARCVLTREEDMINTGKRHPALFKYKVGFSKEGKLIGVEADIHLNAGYCEDESKGVLAVALLNLEVCYRIPNLCARGHVWYTNTQCTSSFRGYGIPQASTFMENIIHDIAQTLDLSQEQIRSVNLFAEGDMTFSGTVLNNCTIGKCWQGCLEQSDYRRTREEFEAFNRQNKWVKRGIAATTVKFSLVCGRPRDSQGAALVNVNIDGSVLISHGGVEMGQGIHTKLIQVASRVLNISTDLIHIKETSTDIVPNATPTIGSQSTDLFGGAVKNACEKLMTRLQPYKDKQPDAGGWKDWVVRAYEDQVNLSATGFWKCDGGKGFDWETSKGKVSAYFTYGAACSQVEVDCLTGDHKLLRTDIVMDVGRSINPAIDIGQIEGAFVMGCGFHTMEENVHSPEGKLLTKNPHTYKIPTINTIPREFNATILKGVKNEFPKAVYSAKGIGEPALILSNSVFLAIKEAILARRRENGLTGIFRLNAPATSEKIRMACGDKLIESAKA